LHREKSVKMKKIPFLFISLLICAHVLAGSKVYTKMTSKPQSGWPGKYLIVYEVSDTKAYVWDGTDDSGNYTEKSISDNKITANDLDAYLVTVSEESKNKYGVKAADGYISTKAGKNGIEYSKGAVDCTIQSNGGYVILETNTNTCRFVYNTKAGRFRFYYDEKKKWALNDYKNICFYVEGDVDVEPSANTLDINYAHAEMYACESKFPTTSNPYYQYYSTYLLLLQEEDENAVPQIGLEILAPTQYSLARTYKSDYTNTASGYINITAGSKHSFFIFPSKEGGTQGSIVKAEMKITKVGPSKQLNAYVYHIKLEFTDSNKKIWTLDKDLDVYAWWIDCDRNGKDLKDMEPVAFALESGKHVTEVEKDDSDKEDDNEEENEDDNQEQEEEQEDKPEPDALPNVKDLSSMQHIKYMHDGVLYIYHNGVLYNTIGQPIHP